MPLLPRITLLLCLAAATAHAQTKAADPPRPLYALHSTLDTLPFPDALASDLFTRSGSTGMVLVVVRNHETLFRSYGETAPGSHQPPTPTSILRLCSLTKIFTTDLLIKLVDDHTLTLDDPLQKFAPPHTLVPSRSRNQITLEDLATHTSGLPREVRGVPPDTPHFTFPDYAQRWRWLPHQQLKATPGTAALYSNVAFDLLGDAISKAASEPFAKLLAERTTTPLGMHETGFTPNPAQCQRLLQGAHDQGPCTDTQSTAGSSGLYSTAVDMTLWLQYLLGTGAPALPAQTPAAEAVYIAPESLASQSGLDHAGSPSGIGLGWMHLLAADDPSHLIEKTGGGAGFATYIALSQPTHTGLFVAFTDGPVYTHFNVFKAANDLLLTLAGLPLMPPEPPKPAPHHTHRKPHHRGTP